MKSIGKITQIIGPVLDIEFEPGNLPAIYNAIRIEGETSGKKISLITEVAAHLGNNVVRTVAMSSTDGLIRGMAAEDTGGPITVPV
ncbi:MAG: F0F1 ATP synthase subunit beta, partial [bacterium]